MSQVRDQFIGVVATNTPLCREHFQLDLRVADFPATRAGQFVQLTCRPIDATDAIDREVQWSVDASPWSPSDPELRSPQAVLRRPFSLAGRFDRDGEAVLRIIHRVVGIGTEWLSRLVPEDRVGVLGPLGNAFTHPAPDETAILVGGGVGIPPMLYLAGELKGRQGVAFCGATTRDLLPLSVTGQVDSSGTTPGECIGEFADCGIASVISSDDGSIGFRGFVTQALEAFLDHHRAAPDSQVIYTCGPEAMMKRVADLAIARGIACQVAVERAMACGMGTCQSCCIRVRKPEPSRPPLPGREWCYRLACTEGPVFAAGELLW